MPTNKGALIRRQVIDKCLSGHRYYSIAEIMERCNARLEEQGFRKVTSENTIRSDIYELEAQYPEAAVAQRRDGRNLSYHYRNDNFSIYHLPLSDDEMIGLTQALSIINRFEGMPAQEWLSNMIKRYAPALKIDESISKSVGFDDNKSLKGREHYTKLLQAIVGKQVLLIRYCGYNNPKETKSIIHPYYLKQFNNRWFLLGFNEELQCLTNFALDRILEITQIPKKYVPNVQYDFDAYFGEMIGVSRGIDDKSETIRLWISRKQLPYILSKPIHTSQNVIEFCDNGAIVELSLIINYELEQLILSLGENVKVLLPSDFATQIKQRISDSLKNYQYAQ